ncbi:MAG TPA: hypothetical protein VHW09_31875 [Bryobacteraceae bacterium]|jgi:VWFA-related protein|nr:hypothetical protein [Bryobacteraceae bacterium]
MRKFHLCAFCLCGTLLLAQSAGSGANTPPVVVDAVVTGPDGSPIHGLAAADFHVLQDGKEQAIAAFQTRTGPAAPGISPDQRVVLLFAPQSPESQQWIQQAASAFVAANAGANRLVEIVFTDVCYTTTLTPFMDDGARLQHVFAKWPDLLHCDHPAEASANLRAAYYASVAENLGRTPGHKTVVLFVATAGPLAAADNQPAAAAPTAHHARAHAQRNAEPHQDPYDMEHEFRKADASVYPIQTQTGAAIPAWAVSLAEVTGGHELTALDPLTREENETYRLAIVPHVTGEGTCHDLKVTVDRPDAKVFGRNLFCNVAEPATTAVVVQPRDAGLDTLAASDKTGQTAASASVPYFYEPNGVARVNMALDIPSPVLDPTDWNGKVHAEMNVLGVAYAAGSGEVAARFTHKMTFDFETRAQFDNFLRKPLHCEQQFEIVPGDYQFKVVFQSAKDRFGAVETPLAIQPFAKTQLSLSAIALSRDVQPITSEDEEAAADAGEAPLTFRGNRIAVSGSDVLPKGGAPEAYFEIYTPVETAAARLSMRLRVLDAGGQERWTSGDVDLSSLVKIGSHVIPVALRLPLAGLPPGAYRGELTVKDSAGGQAVREITFRTE